MGSIPPSLPVLDLTCKDPRALEPGTQEWELSSQSVRAALESHGCLLVRYDKIPGELSEGTFTAMRSLFDLPVETKRRNSTPSPLYTYVEPSEFAPHYETLAVINGEAPDKARAFTELMWPESNDDFCNTLNSMSKEMVELARIIMKMIFDSYRLGNYYESCVESVDALFRMIRYSAPKTEEPVTGLPPHTDANYLTILSQNGVRGLLLKAGDGEWFPANPGNGSYVVFVGQALRAWSNGRLHAPLHKVMISGGSDRLSCGMFLVPKGDRIIEAPAELVDEEHPALYKPFTYMDFLDYSFINQACEGVLEMYAGI